MYAVQYLSTHDTYGAVDPINLFLSACLGFWSSGIGSNEEEGLWVSICVFSMIGNVFLIAYFCVYARYVSPLLRRALWTIVSACATLVLCLVIGVVRPCSFFLLIVVYGSLLAGGGM